MITTIVIIFALLILLAPLFPSIAELRSPTDVTPLKVVQGYDTDVTHFARGFRDYLTKELGDLKQLSDVAHGHQGNRLADGTPFQILRDLPRPVLTKKETNARKFDKILIAATPLQLQENISFEQEIYGLSNVETGNGTRVRAILAEGNLRLGNNSIVTRWLHSEQKLHIGHNCTLFARASAQQAIHIESRSHFKRLKAPRILFGIGQEPVPTALDMSRLVRVTEFENIKNHYGKRWVIDGDAAIDEFGLFEGDLVATKNMVIESNALIKGSLKSNGNMYVASRARIEGSVVSTGNIHLAAGCQVTGPVIAEGRVFIHSECILGTPDMPTSVSGDTIQLGNNVVIYGSVWAKDSAFVKA